VKRKINIAQSKLSLLTIFKIAKSDSDIYISKESINIINKSRNYLEHKVKSNNKLIYGVNTGFGSLCSFPINEDQIEELQRNLVNSHNAGVGDVVPEFITKLILLLKIRSLCFGYSGVRLEVIDRLIKFYNKNALPIIKEQGSLGASGDLAPLASVADMLISKSFNAKHHQTPLKLSFKEGLALLNGTQFMSAYGLYCIVEARKIYHLANLIASISLESFSCRKESFDPLVSKIRSHFGQKNTSEEILRILNGSKTFFSNDEYVQDPYSFRCIPQVHGASLDVINHVESIFQIEVDSVTDNPLVFSEEDSILSAGNFHGQPLAMAMDYLAIAISEIGSISERRIFKLISGERGLPLYLTSNPGLKSGSMITQYTAASIVSQNKQYCSPSSVDSIVSSNGQEDHVSMGANAATKLYKVITNVHTIMAIELFNAIQAMYFKKSFKNTSVTISHLMSHMQDANCFPKLDQTDDNPVRKEIDLIRGFVSEFDVLSFLNIGN
tara:strand:- start:5437 stop:6927 length:1491 start_codon:yes stop_codon:yes gene_type:complete